MSVAFRVEIKIKIQFAISVDWMHLRLLKKWMLTDATDFTDVLNWADIT
jgi:hypothetical protein